MATDFDRYITCPGELPELTEKFNHYGFLQEKIGLKGEETKENIFFGLIRWYINIKYNVNLDKQLNKNFLSKLPHEDKVNIFKIYCYIS